MKPFVCLFGALVVLSGCPKPAPVDPNSQSDAGSSTAPDAGSEPSKKVTASSRNQLKFKDGKRYAAELAEALSLKPEEVCNELSTYDCASDVHRIALAGVEPYVLQVFKPIAERSVGSANAVDRIALSACETRAEQDFADKSKAKVFAELTSDPVSEDGRRAVVKRLFEQLLHREASTEEVDALIKFGSELTMSGEPARRFAALSCFSIASSEEALFY